MSFIVISMDKNALRELANEIHHLTTESIKRPDENQFHIGIDLMPRNVTYRIIGELNEARS